MSNRAVQGADVADERPDVLIAEGIGEGGHAGAGDAVADPPVKIAIGMGRQMAAGEVYRARLEVLAERPVALAAGAVADRAVLGEELLPRERRVSFGGGLATPVVGVRSVE